MSLAIGAAEYASQRLVSLLSQLSSAASTSSASTATPTAANSAATVPVDSTTNLTGPAKPSLSGEILMTLARMQEQSQQSGAQTAPASSANPMQNLFNAMDSDGDGKVSQTEMESYLQANGGTQAEADSLYAVLQGAGTSSTTGSSSSSTSSTGLTESQFASAAGSVHGRHHHHHHGGANGGGAISSLMSLLDSNQDGSVSQSEFTNFVTANGGTAGQASTDFTALDTDNSGSITTADLTKAWQNIQSQQGGGAFATSILDAFAKANMAASASTTNVTA